MSVMIIAHDIGSRKHSHEITLLSSVSCVSGSTEISVGTKADLFTLLGSG